MEYCAFGISLSVMVFPLLTIDNLSMVPYNEPIKLRYDGENFMHLLRVQVPEFRALKNVDIEFEKDFIPKVFPLGSQNGGGKSTLLQLIFVLLHCSTHPDRLPFLKNLLAHVSIPEGESHKMLAKMDIWDGERVVQIEFLCCNETFLEPLKSNGTTAIGDISFASLFREKAIKAEVNEIEAKISYLSKYKINSGLKTTVMTIISDVGMEKEPIWTESSLEEKLKVKKQEYAIVRPIAVNLLEFLKVEKLLYITDYSNAEKQSLLCRIAGMEVSETPSFLHKLADKIFLAAPSTHIYLFLSPSDRKLLFKAETGKTETGNDSYERVLKWSKTELPGFFTYNILSTEVIAESFRVARDQDFAEAVHTGQYGNHYQQLLKEMNKLLATGKQILPQLLPIGVNTNKKDDVVEGVRFKTEDGTELYPEDLSHGELKRLGVYVWLKYRQIEDAIVLMDEVENALHPDWQYQIVLDLIKWGPKNQYILATHSYELCQVVTPAHVKDLEPKLFPAK
jgi:energy-coupling factor transporter ATP-binding protein EcfA2